MDTQARRSLERATLALIIIDLVVLIWWVVANQLPAKEVIQTVVVTATPPLTLATQNPELVARYYYDDQLGRHRVRVAADLLVPANTWIHLVATQDDKIWILGSSRTNYDWNLNWKFEAQDVQDGRKLTPGQYRVLLLAGDPDWEKDIHPQLEKMVVLAEGTLEVR